MAISVTTIHDELRAFLQVHLRPEVIDLLVNSDYLKIINRVTHHLNEAGCINMERWKQTGGSTTAEDSNYTNYLMAGDILKVLNFWYEDEDWEDQYYSYVDDRIVLENSADGIDMDIRYIRRSEEVSELSDEVDLPDTVIADFMDLLKLRLLIDYGDKTEQDYTAWLELYARRAQRAKDNKVITGMPVSRHWFLQNDDEQYDITDHYISLDNFVVDVNGDYTYIE